MSILDGSIVNVAVPKIMAVFGVGTDEIQWVLTAYLLVSGVVIPLSGYLGDVFGYKRMYIFTLAFFTLGSLLCGLSWSNTSLVAARVCQAVGGGMLVPISMGMLFKVVPRGQMGMAMGIWGISAMMAPTIGPTLGGYLADNFSWNMIFFINLPVGLIGMFLAVVFLRETPLLKARFDLLGCLLSSAGCFALLLALSEGQDKGWTSQYIVTLLVAAFFSLLMFVLWELGEEDPLLDVRMLANPVFAVSLLTTAVLSIGLFGGLFLMPIFTENLLNLTPTQTGLLLMPAALTSGLMMPISGRLYDKIGAKPLALVGLSVVAFTTWELHKINLDISTHWLQMMMMYRSLGMGLAMMPISTAGMEAVPARLSGRASSLNNLVRQVAASFGIAIFTSLMTKRQVYHFNWMRDDFGWSSPVAYGALQQVKQALALSGDGALAVFGMVAQRVAMASAIADCFIVSALMVAVAIPLSLFLGKKVKVAGKGKVA
ncbi:EmrB/QacA subfamily drug resistance transporter [Desulfofundulus luciae]|uniref:EmrB/QacA subfamily drug resistance transporter n=2 Tax=Desulfofundulus luciae TaxID=74702 RepID=A0ABU0AXB4_9FIRM|nr:EmrB/QacA subfamily drug resistance transporter [Desulfofundulus luciae]